MEAVLPHDQFLQRLPFQIAASVMGIQPLNEALLRGYLRRGLSPGNGRHEQYVLRRFDLDLRFFINKNSTGHLFFFFKRKKRPLEVVIDIALHFTLLPIPDQQPPERIAKAPVYKWQTPPFLILDERLRTAMLAPTEGRISSKALIIIAGNREPLLIDFLRQNNKKKKKLRSKVKIWFDGRFIEADPKEREWEARPFLLLYESIRSWMAKEQTERFSTSVILDEDNDLNLVIRKLMEAYRATSHKLAGKNSTDTIMAPFTTYYQLDKFEADLLLRLDDQGDFAVFNSAQSYQVGLQFSITEKPNYLEALFEMTIPDFLSEGKLYEAFWNLFLEAPDGATRIENLHKALQNQGYQSPGVKKLEALLQDGKAGNGNVFRLDRNRRIDINLFFIKGFIDDKDCYLIFSGKFEVQQVSPAIIRSKDNSFDIHYFGENDRGKIDQKFVEYFLRIIWYFQKWLEIL